MMTAVTYPPRVTIVKHSVKALLIVRGERTTTLPYITSPSPIYADLREVANSQSSMATKGGIRKIERGKAPAMQRGDCWVFGQAIDRDIYEPRATESADMWPTLDRAQ